MNTRERIVKGGRSTFHIVEVFQGTPEDDRKLWSKIAQILINAPKKDKEQEERKIS